MFFKKILWIFPFIFFLLGYQFLGIFFTTTETEVPIVVGKTLGEGSRILSSCNLNLRILSEKEDADLAEGTIVDQSPLNQKIKSNQSVYLVISRKPKSLAMPEFRTKNIEEALKFFLKQGIKTKVYPIDSNLPQGQCLSHYPFTDDVIKKNNVILYASSEAKKPILFPDFRGIELEKVTDFLKSNDLRATVFSDHDDRTVLLGRNYIVIDQKPLAGTLLQLSKNIDIQLQVKERKL